MAATTEEIKSALLDLLAPKKAKKKSVPKYVLVVDDKVLQSRPTSKKELQEAVIAIKLKNTAAKVIYYKLEGELSLNLPVGGIQTEETSTEE